MVLVFKVSSDSGSEGKASVYNVGDLGSIPGSGRSPGEGNGILLSTLAWKIPWTEKPGRLQSMGSQRVGHDFTFRPVGQTGIKIIDCRIR